MSEALPNPITRLLNTPVHELISEGPTGSLSWRVALARAGLPTVIAGAIGKVMRRTRLWRGEQLAVVRELIAHFRDGLDAGGSPDSLVVSFGDPKQTARLIRRAKRRCRPLWWQAWWWAWRFALVLAVGCFGYGVWLCFGKADPRIDYLAQLNAPIDATPLETHAWPLYEQALEKLNSALGPPTEQERRTTDRTPLPPLGRFGRRYCTESYDELSPGKREELDLWLEANQEIVASLRRAASRPTLGFGAGSPRDFPASAARLLGYDNFLHKPNPDDVWEGSLINARFPQQELSYVGWIFDRDLRSAAAAGEPQRALADVIALIDAADQAGEPPLTLGKVLEMRQRAAAVRAVSDTLTRRPELWDNGQLRDLAHRLSQPARDISYYVRGEHLMFRDVVQRAYTDDGAGDGHLTADAIRTFGREMGLDGRRVGSLSPGVAGEGFNWFVQQLGTSMLATGEMVRLSMDLRSRAEEERAAAELYRHAATAAPLWAQPRHTRPAYFNLPGEPEVEKRPGILELLFFADESLAHESNRVRGKTDGVLVGLALELYRREFGEYPASLDKLSPRWLPEVPVDRINGGPLGYRIVDGEPVVYSLGVDADDDGGRLPRYMDDEQQQERGFSTDGKYHIGPPLTEEERNSFQPHHYRRDPSLYDGDWVIWSLVESRAGETGE